MTTQTQWTRFDHEFLRLQHISLDEQIPDETDDDGQAIAEGFLAVAMVMILLMVFDWSWWKP